MKNVFAVFLLLAVPVFAGEDYTKQEVIEITGSAKVLHGRALSWITERYVSGKDVIQLNDQESGKIVAKGVSNIISFIMTVPMRYTMIIETKNNKVRFTIKDPVMIFRTNDREPAIGEEKTVHAEFQRIIDDFTSYMKSKKESSDW